MAVIREMTTTAFRLKDEMLGRVYVYRAGEALAAAWQRQRRPGTGAQLPFRSLVSALRIHASDFVVMQRRINDGDCWIIARRPLDMEWLHGLLQVWEMTVLGDETPGRVSRYLADLHESSLELASLVERRAGRPPPPGSVAPGFGRSPGGRWPSALLPVLWRLRGESFRCASTPRHAC